MSKKQFDVIPASELELGDRFYRVSDRNKTIFECTALKPQITAKSTIRHRSFSYYKPYDQVVFLRNVIEEVKQ